MGLTFLTGYVLGQHGAQSARLAMQSGSGSGPSRDDILDVDERVDRLLLVVDAMWSLLEDNGYSDTQLIARIREIDLADGAEDQRRTPQPTECAGCGAMVPVNLPACQFCGTEVPGHSDNPFTAV